MVFRKQMSSEKAPYSVEKKKIILDWIKRQTKNDIRVEQWHENHRMKIFMVGNLLWRMRQALF